MGRKKKGIDSRLSGQVSIQVKENGDMTNKRDEFLRAKLILVQFVLRLFESTPTDDRLGY
jgi:hypothetical protein